MYTCHVKTVLGESQLYIHASQVITAVHLKVPGMLVAGGDQTMQNVGKFQGNAMLLDILWGNNGSHLP